MSFYTRPNKRKFIGGCGGNFASVYSFSRTHKKEIKKCPTDLLTFPTIRAGKKKKRRPAAPKTGETKKVTDGALKSLFRHGLEQ